MKRSIALALVLAPTAALVLPPFLLVPLIYRLPNAQLFKDFYEVCLWISPGVGIAVLGVVFRLKQTGAASFRQLVTVAAMLMAVLDLVSPLFFYVFLALVAGH